MQERLQKILARAGVASRRKAEEMIVAGLVTINGEPATELGVKADSETDTIKVRGKVLRILPFEPLYLALHKPKGYITSTDDPEGRRTVMELLGPFRDKVYPVGRLDYYSEGLLLFTNDGDFANYITSAKSQIPKTYVVKVNGSLTFEQLEKFRRGGIKLDGRPTAPAEIRFCRAGANPWYTVTLTEGRNRQIRRMFQHLGLMVEKIRRIQVGPVKLGRLANAALRELTPRELNLLRHPEKARPPRRARSGASAPGAKPAKRSGPANRSQSGTRAKAAKRSKPSRPGKR